MKTIDVAIIGAGSAGIAARSEVARSTDNYVVIDNGALGTTCARVGCMPSKAFIQVANDFHRRRAFAQMGILGADALRVDRRTAMDYVRGLRDRFVAGVLADMRNWQDHLLRQHAAFLDANTLLVGEERIRAKHIVIATGSSPVWPQGWRAHAKHLVDTDQFFEQETLPDRMAVIGLGAIGMELGQAVARLGIEVVGVNRGKAVAGLTSPALQDCAVGIAAQEMRLAFGSAEIESGPDGALHVKAGDATFDAPMALIALGRKPNLAGLGLDRIGIALDAKGMPQIEPGTTKIANTNIYLAGDASGGRAIFHEAVDEGRIAGYNAAQSADHCFERRVPLAITFTDPNMALVGKTWKELTETRARFVVGEASFSRQGRALIMSENEGRIEVYADAANGRLLGSEMMAPHAEHLAHLVALALARNLTLDEFLSLPFYHPVIEEGLRTAFKDAAHKLKRGSRDFELMRCDEPPVGATTQSLG